MNTVDCLLLRTPPSSKGLAAKKFCTKSSGRAAVCRPAGQPCRAWCAANRSDSAWQRCGSSLGPLAAGSRAAQHAGIRPQRHAGARQTTSAASAGFASGAADDFRSADMVADNSSPIAPLSPAAAAAAVQSKGWSGLAVRVVFGTALGVAGALVILTGGWSYMISACFVAYQASREYFGFLTSKVCAPAACAEAHPQADPYTLLPVSVS